MALNGGDLIQLSLIEARALNQFRQQRDWLKGALYDYLKANPTATQIQAANHINGLADAFPTDEVAIRDRVALLSYYVTTAGGWTNVKALVAQHPKWYVLKLGPEVGFPSLSTAERKLVELLGDKHKWGISQVSDLVVREIRSTGDDPTKGHLIETQYESPSLGYRVKVPWIVTFNNTTGKVERTPGIPVEY